MILDLPDGLNPYFIGLPILILYGTDWITLGQEVSILILLDYLFLFFRSTINNGDIPVCLNPYFIGLPILIYAMEILKKNIENSLNPYFIGLPILII